MNTFKKILVTGGCGFIGSALIRKLLKSTNAEVYNLDKLSPVSDNQSILDLINSDKKISKKYNFREVDLANYSLLDEIFNQINPDLIFHLAAESHVDRSIINSLLFLNSNIIGTYNLIEIIRNYLRKHKDHALKFLHISTDEVYGSLGKEGKFNELTPYDPKSPYSASKACSDHLVRAWRHTYNLPFIVTNCSNNFGEWQFPEKLIPLTIQKFLNNEQVPIYGDGLQIRDWLYVEDHVDALLLIAEKGTLGKDYCIGGKSEKTNIEIVKKISNIINSVIPEKHNLENLISYVKDRPGHDRRYAIDFSKLKNDLGWQPKYTFDKALEITIKWYLNNQSWCSKVLTKSKYKTERLGLID